MKADAVLIGFVLALTGCLPITDYDSGPREYRPVQQQTFGEPSRIGAPEPQLPATIPLQFRMTQQQVLDAFGREPDNIQRLSRRSGDVTEYWYYGDQQLVFETKVRSEVQWKFVPDPLGGGGNRNYGKWVPHSVTVERLSLEAINSW